MSKISYYIKKRVGNEIHSFSVEGESLHDVVMQSKKLSFHDVSKCGACGSEYLNLSAHVTEKEGHEYTLIKCGKCKSFVNFGQQKKNDDIFYLRTRDEIDQNGHTTGKKELDWQQMQEDGRAVAVQVKFK